MKILALETSCDDLSWAVVEDGTTLLTHAIASQVETHTKTGGVVPEVAAREHVISAMPVLDSILAQVNFDDIDAIAVTVGPGLIGSLLVGITTAVTLSVYTKKPLIPVHHIAGHIYALFLERKEEILFPMVVLTVSGGHNDLYLMRGHGDYDHIGATTDDAAGEAYDKVARMLGLGYPGGPAIDAFISGYKPTEKGVALPQAYRKKGDYNFSFSGLKSEVRRRIHAHGDSLSVDKKKQMAYEFRENVVDILAWKAVMAVRDLDAASLGVTGGVSASDALREKVSIYLGKEKSSIPHYFPTRKFFSTDNAAMIATAAYWLYTKGKVSMLTSEDEKLSLAPVLSYRL